MKSKLRNKIALKISAVALGILCSANLFAADNQPQDLTNLGFVSVPQNQPQGIQKIRLQAIEESATTLGAQGGLAWQAVHLNEAIDQEANSLDHIFNFNSLLIDNKVLPPVLANSGPSTTSSGPNVIRSASASYYLISPAKIVTTAPNWRNYLEMNYQKPSPPDASLIPRDKNETAAWNYYLAQGWKQGVAQANSIFSANINRLKRDYNGMILYRKLLAQGMVSAPHMASADLGVTGDATHLRIGDSIYRITSNSSLQPNSNLWSPVITDDSQQQLYTTK